VKWDRLKKKKKKPHESAVETTLSCPGFSIKALPPACTRPTKAKPGGERAVYPVGPERKGEGGMRCLSSSHLRTRVCVACEGARESVHGREQIWRTKQKKKVRRWGVQTKKKTVKRKRSRGHSSLHKLCEAKEQLHGSLLFASRGVRLALPSRHGAQTTPS